METPPPAAAAAPASPGAPAASDPEDLGPSLPARLAGPAAVAVGALAASVTVGWLSGRVAFLPPCPLHALTGLWCPFCGGTRAVDAMVAGDVGAAAGFNLLLVLAVPLVALAWARWALARARGRPAAFLDLSSRTLAVLTTIAVAYGVLRNLPGLEMLTPPG